MPRLTQITPFVPVAQIDDGIAFFRDVLGFACNYQAEGYAFMKRDEAAVRLVQVDADVDLHDPARQGSFYIDVVDIDALYAELKPRLDRLPEGHVRAPFNQPYRQREFHVAYDATLIFFGQHVTE